MFEINKILLSKMGWIDCRNSYNTPYFGLDGYLVKFYIQKDGSFILIKDLPIDEKQNSKKLYNFVVGNRSFEFDSNIELLKLIIKYEACNEDYKRHFKLNKILE